MRSILPLRVLDPRKKLRSPWKLSRTVNAFTSLRDSRVGVSVFERCRARSTHEFTRPQRFIFAKVAVHLPAPSAAATSRLGGKCEGISSVVTNVVPPVHRCNDPSEPFLFHRAQKIARIRSSVESGLRYRRCVKTTFRSETRFHWRVVKCAHHEVLAVMSLRAPGQPLILICEPFHHFRPRNVRTQLRANRS